MEELRMRRIKRKYEEGSTGIGALMIFIAIVLVAAVASKVLINTMNTLKQQSEKTGDQALLEVSSAFKVLDVSLINYENFDSNEVEKINLKIGLYGGSKSQDLHQTAIQLTSSDKDVSLLAADNVEDKADDEVYGWEPILKLESGDTDSPYIEVGDLYILTLDLIAEDDQNRKIIGALGPQDELDINILPKHGTSTYEQVTIPPTMSGSTIINTQKEAVQLDFSSIYDSDTIITSSETDDGIQESDGTFDSWAGFITQAVAEEENPSSPDGLPNDGVFGSNSDHPKVDLDWSGLNTWKANSVGDSVTAGVPDENYEEIHIYTSAAGAGSGNPAKYTITLNYDDGSSTTSDEFTTPDWYGDISGSGYYLIDGMDRWEWSTGYDDDDTVAIFGHSVSADEAKTLESVTIEVTEMQANVFGFFGGVAKTTGGS